MWKESDAGTRVRGSGLSKPAAAPKGHARTRKLPREPDSFGQKRIGLIERDERRFAARFDLATGVRRPIKAEVDRRERLGDDVAVERTSKTQRDVGLSSLEAYVPELRRQIDIEPRILRRQFRD